MLNEPCLSFYFLRLRFKSPAPSFVSLSLVFYVYVFSMTSTTEILLKHVEEEVYGGEHEDAFSFFRIFIINKFSEYISVHHGILQRRFSPLVRPSECLNIILSKNDAHVLRSLCKRLYVASIPTLSNWANESKNLAIAYVPLCVNKLPQKIGQSSLTSLFHHTEKKTKKRKWKQVTVKQARWNFLTLNCI